MVPIMSWIVHWRRNGLKASLNDICMNHLFKIEKGKLKSINSVKGHKETTTYIHSQCKLTVDANYNTRKGCSEFRERNRHKKYTRGKYLLWFLCEFCLSIHKDCLKIATIQSIKTQPKNSANLSHSNAMVLISSRFRVPESLNKFLQNTVKCYIARKEAALDYEGL